MRMDQKLRPKKAQILFIILSTMQFEGYLTHPQIREETIYWDMSRAIKSPHVWGNTHPLTNYFRDF